MCAENCDSMIIKESLKSLCCNNGWCYGVFWGFDQRKTLLLTLKDAYYEEEEQIGVVIDSMLMQVHVLGGGVIGQVAFTQNHQWMYSDTDHHQNSYSNLASFQNLQDDDSEFYSQFCMGIKTIALISVEPWGVVQFGSTHKNPETKEFVGQVKKMMLKEVSLLENHEHDHDHSSSSSSLDTCQFLDIQFNSSSSSSSSISHSQSFPSTPNHHHLIDNPIHFEDYLLESAGNTNLFDCSATTQQPLIAPILTSSSWPHSTLFDTQHLSTSNFINQSDYKAHHQPPSDLLTMEDLLQETNNFAKSSIISSDHDNHDFISSQLGPNTTTAAAATSFTTLLTTDHLSNSTGLIPLSGFSGNNYSPINMPANNNLPTNSIQTDAFRSSNNHHHQVKYPGTDDRKLFINTWDETLVPVKTRTSNTLFSQLGLDHLLDGTSSCGFEDQSSSSAAKRRRTDGFSSSLNQVKSEGPFGFDGKMTSLNPVFDPKTRNIGLHSEASMREAGSCIGDHSCIMDASNNTSSSEIRQDEPVKTAKKKAKPGTKPRPKDRQMIQDRLAELRDLIPSGEKMSIDRLLERTIRHLNFMQSLIKHAETLEQIDKPKSIEVPKNQSSKDGGGVIWACEVGNQSTVSPLIVEDLVTPGQMLIEILCEEQGFFLEIADIIRGFGLSILKGVIEVREHNKIWAHFLVQSEGSVTRHEIFSSLIHLLQMTGQTSSNGFGNVGATSSFNNNICQPAAAVSFPVNLSDALQCANL